MHRNAKLTPAGRRILVERIQSGRPAAHVAAEMGVARKTAYKWWQRWLAEGEAGLQDRSSRPQRSPARVPARLERRIERLRRRRKLGPARIAWRLRMAPSTVYRVLYRFGLNRLSWLDRPTGRVIRRRYEHPRPGDLLHMDVKKLGRIPPGGGWRVHGRGRDRHHGHSRVGYAYIHSVVDDHSRLAYSEVLADERAVTTVAFWQRACAWFAERGVTVRAVLTDNGPAYRSSAFARACLAAGVRRRRTRPYHPQTNGKVERFHRTFLEEWAYVRVYRSEAARTAALALWLHRYNHYRRHTALGGHPPVSRVTNLPEDHSCDAGQPSVPRPQLAAAGWRRSRPALLTSSESAAHGYRFGGATMVGADRQRVIRLIENATREHGGDRERALRQLQEDGEVSQDDILAVLSEGVSARRGTGSDCPSGHSQSPSSRSGLGTGSSAAESDVLDAEDGGE